MSLYSVFNTFYISVKAQTFKKNYTNYIKNWIYSGKPVATTIQTATEFFSHKYKMDYPNRGKAIIINNKTFNPKTKLNERTGTDKDATALDNRLSELGFDVDLKNNLTADKIKATLQKGQQIFILSMIRILCFYFTIFRLHPVIFFSTLIQKE